MCLFFKRHLSHDEALELLNNERIRTITWSDDVVKAAGKLPQLSREIIANANYRTALNSHNVAKILAVPANKNLALSLVASEKPHLQVLQALNLHGIYKISANHSQFFLNLLDLKQQGHMINAFNEITEKTSYIAGLAINSKSICDKLREHPDILEHLKVSQLKEIADKNPEFGRWLVRQPELMSKFQARTQKKLQEQFPAPGIPQQQPSSETACLLTK
jgi:hypothetical protein